MDYWGTGTGTTCDDDWWTGPTTAPGDVVEADADNGSSDADSSVPDENGEIIDTYSTFGLFGNEGTNYLPATNNPSSDPLINTPRGNLTRDIDHFNRLFREWWSVPAKTPLSDEQRQLQSKLSRLELVAGLFGAFFGGQSAPVGITLMADGALMSYYADQGIKSPIWSFFNPIANEGQKIPFAVPYP